MHLATGVTLIRTCYEIDTEMNSEWYEYIITAHLKRLILFTSETH